MKWIRRTLYGLLGLVLLLAVALFVYSRRALPATDGALAMPGLQGEVRIERDADGIPTIHAANLPDLMYGLGVAHAQDRLWQLETHRRIGAGRLAEAFGEPALETDRFLRALGVRRAAAEQWAQTKGEARVALEAYARGINATLHGQMKARPPEMLVLGIHPEDWDPVDSLAWGLMMAWDLGGNWSSELLRLRLAARLPVERINELLPPYPGEQPLAIADYPAIYGAMHLDREIGEEALAAAPPSGIEGVGSNNWVVAGSHTQSGKPLLANDPHLKLSAPALWYFARLEAPGIKVAGATMPGLPLVVLGQNEHVAWGFTNTNPDVQDLYIERIKADDPGQYLTPDGWARFETHEEVIKVKGRPEVKLLVRRTRHGPVISDSGIANDILGRHQRPAYALAMRWTALDPDAELVSAGLGMARARSIDDFVAATRSWVAPMQNMVVADTAGHIGFVASGRVPVRKPQNDLKGQVPAPGWEARYDWAGFIAPDATPREIDPPRGWIATANQRVVPADYPHYLTNEWAVPYRHQRIEQLLQATPRHTPDSFGAMQSDVQSLAVPRILPWLLKAKSQHPLAPAAVKALQGFDGRMAADQAAPLIFWAWARQVTRGIFADEIGKDFYDRTIGGRTFRTALEGVLERNDAWWCDDKDTPDVAETCAMQADAALGRALNELQASHGSDVSQWRWGDVHQARSEHRPFSKVKALARFFELRAPVGGDSFTVNVSQVSMKPDATTGELYLDEHGPSLRAIYDLADPKQSRFMHSSGQSGIPFSPQYRSFVERWAGVRYVPVWASGAAEHTLVLQPAGSR